jgi:hypothetical protein
LCRSAVDTAKDWKGYTPDPRWKVDLMIISDGGKFLQATNASGLPVIQGGQEFGEFLTG